MWKDIINKVDWSERRDKRNVEQRIRGIILNWVEDYDEFLEDLTQDAEASLKILDEMEEDRDDQVDDLPENMREILETLFTHSKRLLNEARTEVNKTVESIASLRKTLDGLIPAFEEADVKAIIIAASESFSERRFIGELGEGIEEPKPPNWNRLLQQLEFTGRNLE